MGDVVIQSLPVNFILKNRLPCLLLMLAVLIAYLPAIKGGYVWDDDSYVTENKTLQTVEGLRYIWFKPGATTQYYPMVHTTFWIEYRLWKMNPLGFHLVNVLLHALNAILLFAILRKLSVPGALFAAALFALHPVHVESVAWITERKNVLSGLFYLSAFLAFLRFHAIGKRRFYFLSLALFLLALLSKTVVASLPAAILLALWWKEGGLRRSTVLLLLPFFALGAGLGLFTAWVETHLLGATGEGWAITIVERCLIAGRALWFYAGKLAWPSSLTFVYPRWEIDAGSAIQYLYPAAALLVVALLSIFRRTLGTGALIGTLFFCGTLAPALGFINVYPFRFSFVADHFQYLASIGLITLFAAAADGTARRFRLPAGAVRTAALVLLALLGTMSWRQAGSYESEETLWRDTIAKNDRCWMAYNNLGTILGDRGDQDGAMILYRKAIALKPDYDKAHNNLGIALDSKGELAQAIFHYRKVLDSSPDNAIVRNNLGVALTTLGRVDEAIAQLLEGLRIRPHAPQLHTNLGIAFEKKGELSLAIQAMSRAAELVPQNPDAHFRLATLLHNGGMLDEAAGEYNEALRLQPAHRQARIGLERLQRERQAQSTGGR